MKSLKRSTRDLLFLVSLLVAGTSSLVGAADEPLIAIKRATVVAFFRPVAQKELVNEPDVNEALADFQYYASKVREPLKKAGVDFREVYAVSFRIRVGNKSETFRPSKGVGYYLIEPGKKPRLEDGVMTDIDLFAVVREYFGVVVK